MKYPEVSSLRYPPSLSTVVKAILDRKLWWTGSYGGQGNQKSAFRKKLGEVRGKLLREDSK